MGSTEDEFVQRAQAAMVFLDSFMGCRRLVCCFQQLGVESQASIGTKTHRGRKPPAVQRIE